MVTESAAHAALLRHDGLAGRHIGVLLANVPEYVFLLGGAALSGRSLVGINPTRRGDELARDIRHTDCAVVLTDSSRATLLDGLDLDAGSACSTRPEWLEQRGGTASAHSRRAAGTGDAARAAVHLRLNRRAESGADEPGSGRPHHRGRSGGFRPDDVLYCAMPLFHGNALLANLFPAMAAGATVALRDRFSASSFLADVRRHGCSYFNYVGRVLSYVLAQPESPDDADNPLRWCMGSEASPRHRREFRRRFGCHVMEGYSSSEGAMVIQPVPGHAARGAGPPRRGSRRGGDRSGHGQGVPASTLRRGPSAAEPGGSHR